MEALPHYPVIVVTGPRQSGKSTMCRHMFEHYLFANLEMLSVRTLAETDPHKFLSQSSNMIIDEVQNVPSLLSEIQAMVDADPTRRYILTGSNNFALLERVTQSLAGRAALFTLLPLALTEVDVYSHHSYTDTLLVNGLYPGVICKGVPNELFFGNYYDTYVERDAHRLFNIRMLEQFQMFVRLCAGRVANLFNINSLAVEVGVAAKTISEWYNVLSASYIAYKLHPYYANIAKRLGKTPKLYFYDVGLACYLLGITTPEQLSSHPLRGALFENLAVNELLKRAYNQGRRPQLAFYRERNGLEVDILEGSAPRLHAYEVKSSMTLMADLFKNLNYLKHLMESDIIATTLIYDGPSAPPEIVNVRDI